MVWFCEIGNGISYSWLLEKLADKDMCAEKPWRVMDTSPSTLGGIESISNVASYDSDPVVVQFLQLKSIRSRPKPLSSICA